MTNRFISHVTTIDQARPEIIDNVRCVWWRASFFFFSHLSQLFNSFLYWEMRFNFKPCNYQHYRASKVYIAETVGACAYFSPSPKLIYSCVAGINQSAVSIANVFSTNIRHDVRSSRIDPDLLSKVNVKKREYRYKNVLRFLLDMRERDTAWTTK